MGDITVTKLHPTSWLQYAQIASEDEQNTI